MDDYVEAWEAEQSALHKETNIIDALADMSAEEIEEINVKLAKLRSDATLLVVPEGPEEDLEGTVILVGYARRSNEGRSLKVSINTSALSDCETYTTSDGQTYVPLVISISALSKILSGERAVTTVSQLV